MKRSSKVCHSPPPSKTFRVSEDNKNSKNNSLNTYTMSSSCSNSQQDQTNVGIEEKLENEIKHSGHQTNTSQRSHSNEIYVNDVEYLMERMELLIDKKLTPFATKNDVDKILEEVESIKNQQIHLENQIKNFQQSEQNLKSAVKNIEQKIAEIPNENTFKNKISELKSELCVSIEDNEKRLKTQIDQLRKQLKRNNIVVKGLSSSTVSEAKHEILNLLTTTLNLSDAQIVDIYMVKNKVPSDSQSAIVELHSNSSIQEIFKNCKNLKDTKYSINKDLPRDMRRRRNILFVIRKILIKNFEGVLEIENKPIVKIKDDSLYVGKLVLNWDDKLEKLVCENGDGFLALSTLYSLDLECSTELSSFINSFKGK